MRIDVHAHYVPESCADLLEGRTTDAGTAPNVLDSMTDLQVRLRHMDERGIDVALLAAPPWLANPSPDVARRLNNEVANAIAPYPDRLVGLATIPMQDPEVAATELERCVKDLGFRGMEILTNVEGENLHEPRFAPVYRKMEELDVAAFMHPQNVVGARDRLRPFYLSNFIGNPTDTAIAAACLIFGGVLQEFPRLRFVLAHGGGSCPFLLGRWEHGWRLGLEGPRVIHRPPTEYYRLLYFDSLTHSGPALNYLVETAGYERVMLGSDYPFAMGDPNPAASVAALPHVSDAEREAIFGGNAVRVFGLGVRSGGGDNG